MKQKITIIGAGAVGAATAFALLTRGEASEIVLIDINTDKALGEALDIKQATPFLENCDIYAGSYADAANSDMVIITSGVGRKPGQSRLELVQINVGIVKSIAEQIVRYAPNALYVMVTNPVDIMTYAFLKYTGLPKNQVFGTGTLLDTVRLRTRLSEIYHVNKQQVHAHVLGEHGDSSFVAWSSATIAGIPIADYCQSVAVHRMPIAYQREDIEAYVHRSGGKIIARKGSTVYGVATSCTHIAKMTAGNAETAMTVSSLHEGEYGINGVCLSSLSLVDSKGVRSILTQKLSEDELRKMHESAAALQAVIRGVEF